MQTPPHRILRRSAPLALAALLLTGCATTAPSAAPAAAPSSTPTPTATVGGDSKEVATPPTRILYSHDRGLTLLDATSGDVVSETERPGFLRVSDAGNGRHILVADGDKFLVYDAGVETRAHGDHGHHYTYTPGLTDTVYDAPKAGHAVVHAGRTTLFSDGAGEVQVIESSRIADPRQAIEKTKLDAAHHGVAVALSDDSLLTTQGTTESRSTIQVRKGDQVVAQTDDCPSIHGEASAQNTKAGDVVLFGCSNGASIWRDGAFHKVATPDAGARIGTAAGSPSSPVVLTDYKLPHHTKEVRTTTVALVDAHANTMKTLDLGSSYSFRSLARGAHGEGLVLTYDGALKVIDPKTAKVESIPAIGAWQEQANWQEPGPSVVVAGHHAYVADAAASSIAVVDLEAKKVVRTIKLAHTPVEVAVVTGKPADAHDEHGHEGHGHG